MDQQLISIQGRYFLKEIIYRMIHICGSLQVSYFCSFLIHGCESQNLECTSLELLSINILTIMSQVTFMSTPHQLLTNSSIDKCKVERPARKTSWYCNSNIKKKVHRYIGSLNPKPYNPFWRGHSETSKWNKSCFRLLSLIAVDVL